ncbi:serine/arginine repetitive matrix protein 1-like [Ochlerotatus camptorhynchus]|uniref:serine/arginine repetitive matrix protein 1-like n=1 Tax=Ochlerotatus camptorhynchus TaxID=644619 RepID=UPI0031D08D72
MSLQVQSSQQPTSGRRTPQIYQNLGTTGSATSPAPPTNGNSATAKASSKLSLKSSSGGKQSPVVEVAGVQEPTALKDAPKTSNLVVAVTKLDKTPISTATPPNKEKDEKDKGATNGSSNGSNHSEKETNGNHEEPAVLAKPETPKQETVEKVEKEKKVKESPRASPRSTPQKQQQSDSIPVEQVKTPESPGKKTTPVVTPDQKTKPDTSLAAEKTLKGFTAEGDEMESLIVEPSEYEDSPMPPRTGGKTKLLKYTGAPPTRARISPYRVHEAATNTSTIVNLSTVSEGGQSSATDSKETSPSMDFNRPLRAISGRRGTRPISDIQYTYRKSTEPNDSTSSLNVTVGSEIHNDSLRTPAPGSSRKRKVMTPESTSDALDVKEVIDSPKRTRLDFSGFFGMVSSPVTMLKNRLSRVRLQSSTPVAKRNFDDEDPSKCVQAEATTTTANISSEGANMEVDTTEAAATTPDETKKAEEVEKTEEGQQQQSTEGQTDLPSEEGATQEDGSGDGSEPPVEVKDVTNKQRPFCVVM